MNTPCFPEKWGLESVKRLVYMSDGQIQTNSFLQDVSDIIAADAGAEE